MVVVVLKLGAKVNFGPAVMSEQPSLGTALLPPHGEGSGKGDLNKACSFHPAGSPRSAGHPICGRNNKEKKRKHHLVIGAWNVRTLLDRDSTTRPERRTALVAHELARYNIDIAALSETRFAGTGEITEHGQGYTFFWSGKAADERRESGVGFAVRTSLIRSLESLPKSINDRLMTMRLPLQHNNFITLISVYAPTMTYSDEEKEAFYEKLSEAVHGVPKTDRLLVLGDFNARVGANHKVWEGVLGPHGIGRENSNGRLLLSFCAQESLFITNTLFDLPDIHKTTWMHPRSKNWHLIDYVITRRKDIKDVMITRAMRGADCWTDHILVRSKLSLKVSKHSKRQAAPVKRKLNVNRFSDPSVKETFSDKLAQKFQAAQLDSSPDCEKRWASFRDTVYSAAEESVGHLQRKHQDWFDDNNAEIKSLLSEKKKAHEAWISDPNSIAKKQRFKSIQNLLQSKIRQMKDKWWADKAAEIQSYADQRASKAFFSGLKMVYGPSSQTNAPLKSSDGTLLTEKSDILDRWTEHFDMLLNRPSSIDQTAIDAMTQRPLIEDLALPPTEKEIEEAIHQLQPGKSPGPDGIPPEVFKEGGSSLLSEITSLFQLFWEVEEVPQDLKDANIVYLYKNKGDKTSCDNYRGISLLSIAGKILAKVIIGRITKHLLDDVVSESQCGFRANRGTVDMIFALRQLQEKCREQHQNLYIMFVDLTKAFDTVSRSGLWSILEKFGCPPKLISVIRAFHDGMQGRVVDSGGTSQPFPVSNGVKQGCVMAPTLFSILFAAMLQSALSECSAGINIRYRMDGDFFYLKRLKAKTKTTEALIRDFLYADDCALAAHSEEALQELADRLAAAATKFGLTISLSKTEVMLQPAPELDIPRPKVCINGTQLKTVNEFTYLGSCLSDEVSLSSEISIRLTKASAAFGRLWTRVWKEKGLAVKTKIAVYKAVVMSALLYGCESWTLYKGQVLRLEQFHLRCLRKIMGITWQDRIPNTTILRRAGLDGIEAYIMRSQLRWAGHVARMPDDRLPKQIFFSELSEGDRVPGRPFLRFKDKLKESLKRCDIDPSSWPDLAADRTAWRSQVKKGVNSYEAKRLAELDEKRKALKARSAEPPNIQTAVTCSLCGKLCKNNAGLRAHMRIH